MIVMFEDAKRSLEQLQSLLIHTLFDWAGTWGCTFCNSISEFQNSLGPSM